MPLLILSCVLLLASVVNVSAQGKQQSKFSGRSRYFVENKGQWNDEVRFMHKGKSVNVWITDSAVVYDYYKVTDLDSTRKELGNYEDPFDFFIPDSVRIDGHVVRLEFVQDAADKERSSTAAERRTYGRIGAGGRASYFKGNDTERWVRNAKRYTEVMDDEIYEGISTRYYFQGGHLRYDIIVQPGANPKRIKMKFTGANDVRINKEGELEIETRVGKIKHKDLKTFEKDKRENRNDQKGKQINSRFKLDKDGYIRFDLDKYDTTKVLVIDPLIVSTYVGGVNDEVCTEAVTDELGNIYVTGSTQSPSFPINGTPGPYTNSHTAGVGDEDVFVFKLDPVGDEMEWITYFGGNSKDRAFGIVKPTGLSAVCVVGQAGAGFPTANPLQGTHGGGQDGFVLLLSLDGAILEYSSYIGETLNDRALSVCANGSNTVTVLGETKSNAIGVTTGAFQSTRSGDYDCFLQEILFTNVNTPTLNYLTYLGGNDRERPYKITPSSGGVAITGFTESTTNFPTTVGAVSQTLSGGRDIFITDFDGSSQSVIYSTYLGTPNDEAGFSIVVSGTLTDVYTVSGYTTSSNFPVTTGAYQTTWGGTQDAIVCKVTTSAGINACTYVGGNSSDAGTSVSINDDGHILIIGQTNSTNLTTTGDVLQNSNDGGMDVMIARLNSDLTSAGWLTYLGGNGDDNAQALVIDMFKRIIVVGSTNSSNYDTTTGAYDTDLN